MQPPAQPWQIRSFAPADLQQCQQLYREGLIGGKLAENDTGLDIDDIESEYMHRPGNHFWVAQQDGKVVGMVGVQHHDEGTGVIRRLRVAQTHRRRGIGSALMETAVKFCQENQYLKVTLDTFMEREPAIKLFVKFQFCHDRTRIVHGRDLMYFYLDLYTGTPKAHKEDIGAPGPQSPPAK